MWYECVVNKVGPAADGTETSKPVIYINLTDANNSGAFVAGTVFYAADGAQGEMLAVALAAINGKKHVWVGLSLPALDIQRMYLMDS